MSPKNLSPFNRLFQELCHSGSLSFFFPIAAIKKSIEQWAGEMAQPFGAPIVLKKDLGSIPNTHIVAHPLTIVVYDSGTRRCNALF